MAKVFLDVGDTYTAANNDTEIYGQTGDETVSIAVGVTGVVLDQAVDNVTFDGNVADFTFLQEGINLLVYSGGVLVATIPVQADDDGTQLTFDDGTWGAEFGDGAVIEIDGAPVPDDEPGAVVPGEVPGDDDDDDDYVIDGETYVLFETADAYTGTEKNDMFVATEDTLSSADILDGADGRDTLRYASSGNAAVNEAGFEASNIEIVQVTSDTTGGTAFDVTGVTDLETLRNYNSAEDLMVTGLASLVDVELQSVGSAGVGANDPTPDTDLVFNSSVVSGAADELDVTLDNNVNVDGTGIGDLTADGIEIFNVTTRNDATTMGEIASNNLMSVTVDGSQDLTLDTMLTFADDGTVDASTFRGDLDVTVNSGAVDVTVTGGTGDDRADFSNGFDAGDSFDGGAGTDTLVVTNAVATGTPAGDVANIEQLEISTAGTGTVDMDDFTGVTRVIYDAGIAAGATATVDDAVTGITVEVDATAAGTDNLVVDLKTDGTSDEVTVAFDEIGAGDAIASVDAADAETLNMSFDDDTANGTGTFAITNLTATDATSLMLTGDADFTLTNTVDPATPVLATIDASGMTGDVTITGTNTAAAGATVTFGSGDDTFNVATSNGADTITLGEGEDTVVYSALAQSDRDMDTITDFVSGTDVVDVRTLMGGIGVASSTQFAGNRNSFGESQGALSGATADAVFDTSSSILWVDVDGNGTLDNNDFRVLLDGVSSITAADLGFTAGVTFTANVVGFNTAVAGDSQENNAVGPEDDTINATVAQLVGATVNGLGGDNVLNIMGTAAAGEIADLAAIGFTNVATVNIDSSVEGVSMAAADLGNAAAETSRVAGVAGTLQELTVATGSALEDVTISNIEGLDMTGNVSMTVAQHNAWGSITAAGGADQITLTDAGTVTGDADVETYVLGGATNNTFTVGTAAQNVTEAATDTVNAAALMITGNYVGFGGNDTLVVTTGADISGAQGNGGGAGSALGFGTLEMTGIVDMTEAQHDGFAAITAAGAADEIQVTDQFVSTADNDVETYDLNGSDNTITVNGAGVNVNAGADEDVVVVNGGTLGAVVIDGETDTAVGGNSLTDANDTIQLATGSNIAAATINNFEFMGINDNASVTMTAAQFGVFSNLLSGAAAADASGTETITISDAINDDTAGTLGSAVENYTLDSAGDDQFGYHDIDTVTGTIDISAGGSDIISINNAAIAAVFANAATITGFDVSNDELRIADGGTAHNSGFETITVADPNVATAADGVLEIASAITEFNNPTDVGNGASVETAFVNAINTIGDGTYTVIGYGNGNAYLYQLEMADSNANGTLDVAADATVELVGIIENVALDSLTGNMFS